MPLSYPSRLFLLSFVVYTFSQGTLITYDVIFNSIFLFNLLEYQSLNLAQLWNVPGNLLDPYFIGVETSDGVLTSFYPIGVVLITSPLYFFAFLYLKIVGIEIDLSSVEFFEARYAIEKIVSAFIASLSISYFFKLSRLYFSLKRSLSTALIFAFATGTWTISSQNLWQHGATNLVLIISSYSLLKKIEKEQSTSFSRSLAVSALLAGFLPIIRPTNTFFYLSLLYTVWRTQRPQFFFYVLVSLFFLSIGLTWNLVHFDHFLGGYTALYGDAVRFDFSSSYMFQTFWNLLLHPLRGFLIFSPIALFSLFAIKPFLQENYKELQVLLLSLLVASAALVIVLSANIYWHGGFCFGPRYFVDVLFPVIFLLNFGRVDVKNSSLSIIQQYSFYLALSFSVAVQACGAFHISPFTYEGKPIVQTILTSFPYSPDFSKVSIELKSL